MTQLFNDPTAFAAEMAEGFVAANRDRVRACSGGVVRSTVTPQGKVAVVIGGGSGHYPAFGGLVGTGLADGAVLGDVFASPSTAQAVSVGRAAERGAGILLTFGNYAGDVLNFTAAAHRLDAEGIPTRVLAVTDDVASGPVDQTELRRGVAGDLVIFKIAGAAAERGADLDGVEAIARRANAATRSLGIAFSGCTLPGDDHPLFTVTPGHMAVGLGIHGEPGIREEPYRDAVHVAGTLAGTLLAERPEGAPGRVVALLNGLGTTKYEELFVLWRSVAAELESAGIEVAAVEVGELCTSLDMEGCSLTLAWLDDELLELWRDPADSPAFRSGYPARPVQDPVPVADTADRAADIPPAAAASQTAAVDLADALERVAVALAAHESQLGALDAVAGDGDHGRGMTRGSGAAAAAARVAADAGAGVRTTLLHAAESWGDRAGGTSGALWGAALAAASSRLSDDIAPTASIGSDAVSAGITAIMDAGGARPGDKTLIDAMVPFGETLATRLTGGDDIRTAWDAASSAAETAAAATADLTARRGRARVLGDKSLGTPDPGAFSFGIVVRALAGQEGSAR